MSNPSATNLQFLFDAALQNYEKQSGMKLIDQPLAKQLENCNSVDSVMEILQHQASALTQFRGNDGKVMISLNRAVHILHTLSTSTALSEGIGLVRLAHFLVFLVSYAHYIAVPPCKGNIRRLCYPTWRASFPVCNRVSF